MKGITPQRQMQREEKSQSLLLARDEDFSETAEYQQNS